MSNETAKTVPGPTLAGADGAATLNADQLDDLKVLLDHCDAALIACGQELWDVRRDLAIACNQLAQRCRTALREMLA